MKKILYISMVAFTLAACNWQDKPIFEQSAQERMEALAKACKETLVASPYGWKMAYDPKSPTNGDGARCFHFLMKFEANNTVTMWSDISESDKSISVTSAYSVENFVQGATLSFTTNGMLTELAVPDPQNPEDSQYGGDNDFVIVKVTDGKVVLRGIKSGVKVDLIKAEAAETAAAYFAASKIYNDFFRSSTGGAFFPSLLFADNTGVCVKVGTNTRWITFILPNATQTDTLMQKVSVDITADGFRLLQPVTVQGKTLEHFVWNATAANYSADFDAASQFVYSHVTPFPFGNTVDKYKDKAYRMHNYSNNMKNYCMNSISTKSEYSGVELKWNVEEEFVVDGEPQKKTTFNFSVVFQPSNALPQNNDFGIASCTVQRADQVAFTDSEERTGDRIGQLKNDMYVKRLAAFFYDPEGLTVYEEGNYMYLISKADSRNWLQFIRM